MRTTLVSIILVALSLVFLAFTSNNPTSEGTKFIGAKRCGTCHKSKTGDQWKKWEDSKHANAYKTLQTEEADKIAKEKGLGKAVEAKECLSCHATAYDQEALWHSKFDITLGVQCESCHGAGDKYKSKKVMQDHAKSVEAGMTEYLDAEGNIDMALVEKNCVQCHNEKSPTYKEFKLAEKWKEIEHPIPAK